MKTKETYSILVVLTVIAIAGMACVNQSDSPSLLRQGAGESLYKQYCADCHGKNLETFAVKDDWLFGNNDKDILTSIKFGREIVGMPAFDATFNDEEIKTIVNYIKENKGVKAEASEVPDLTKSEKQPFTLTSIVKDNEYGNLLWGIDFTPKGKMLITDKGGSLYFGIPEQKLVKIAGLPPFIMQIGQSGLMDILVHPDYEENGYIYLSYTEGKDRGSMKQLVVVRAILDEVNHALISHKEIFRAMPAVKASHHLGARMVIDKNGYLFIASGERGGNEKTQSLTNHFGKMIRLYDDGRVPDDNPFINTTGALPEIYTLGHRNPQGLIVHPITNAIYAHEHGPKGGDEINLIEAGKNYGWPTILFGINYNGKPISADTAKVGMEQPLLYWLPSIAPCGMAYVDSDLYPGWKEELLIGSLKFEYLARCSFLSNGKITETEKLLRGIGRIRSVKASPKGYLYVVTEKPGAVYRIDPK